MDQTLIISIKVIKSFCI